MYQGTNCFNQKMAIKYSLYVCCICPMFNKVCVSLLPTASYFRGFTQIHTNHQGHSLSGRDYMLRFQRSAMFLLTSCRQASVVNIHLLAPRLGFEPRSRTFVGWHTFHCANTAYGVEAELHPPLVTTLQVSGLLATLHFW